VRSKIATELDGEWVMRARVVVQERRALLADWMSRKSMRAAVLLGVLLTISVAVNAMIIFTDASRP
jgi:beta-lactamase regulating signal transducer with metallopeptidase domain